MDEIGKVIGPGGKIIKDIMDKTDTTIYIDEDGIANITGQSQEALQEAKKLIEEIVTL